MPRTQAEADQTIRNAQNIEASQASLQPLKLSICGENTASKQRFIQHLLSEATTENSRLIKAKDQASTALYSTSMRNSYVFHTTTRSVLLRQPSASESGTGALLSTIEGTDLVIYVIDGNTDLNHQIARQVRLLSLLDIKHILLAIDTDEAVPYCKAAFERISQHFAELIKPLHFFTFTSLPFSSLTGDNLQQCSSQLAWYEGPCLFGLLDSLDLGSQQSDRVVFTLDQIKKKNSLISYSGHLAEGRLQLGDVIRITRSGQTARVVKLHTQNGEVDKATADTPLSLALDSELDTTQGDILSLARLPLETTDHFEATLIWLDGEPGLIGRNYSIQLVSQQTTATITNLKHRINLNSGAHEAHTKLERDDVSVCTIATTQALAFNAYTESKTLGSFRLLDKQSQALLGFGMITHSLRRAQNVHAQALSITATDRAQLNGHKGKVVWFTGLSGSGKSTIANALEVELHALGYRTYLLDGDNVRQGLNKDLGFTDADRVENIRRIAEVAKLMLDAGLIVMTAFISPFRQERQMARELIGEANFIEVYVSTSLEVCEQRDVKGLYRKARSGLLPNLSGIGSPYEPPIAADFEINTEENNLAAGVIRLLGCFKADS